MKRIVFLLALLLVLVACGNEGEQDIGNFSVDESSTDTGIRVHLANDNSLHADQIDAVYFWLATHMLITEAPAPGPFVIFIPQLDNRGPEHLLGLYVHNNHRVYIDDHVPLQFIGHGDGVFETVCHEFVHFFLHVTTGDADSDHHSPYFHDCYALFTLQPGQHLSP